MHKPIPMVARSKAYFCGCSLPGIVGSNSVRGMNIVSLKNVACDDPIP